MTAKATAAGAVNAEAIVADSINAVNTVVVDALADKVVVAFSVVVDAVSKYFFTV